METDDSVFPASFAQRRLWFLQQLDPGSTAYNMVVTAVLPGPVAPALVQAALDALVARHEGLRTRFLAEGNEVVQCIAAQGRLPLQCHELADRDEYGPVLSRSTAEPFDLSQPPLARAHLACFAAGPPMLSLVVHHIIADGQTLRILLDDLATALHALGEGQAAVLPEPAIDYADYAVWQRRMLDGGKRDALTAYWTRRLSGAAELRLPHDHERPATGSTRGGMVPLRIDAGTAAGLRALAASVGTTTFAVLLAGFAALLARFSGQGDVTIGIPVSGRSRVEFERIAGLFVNSLAFRADVTPDASFADLVRQTATQLSDDLSHQDMPFDLVVDALRLPRRVDRNPVFQVMLQLQTQPPGREAAEDAEAPRIDDDKLTSQVDLSFILVEAAGGRIDGAAVFAADVFERASVQQMADAFGLILAEAVRCNECRIGDLPLLAAHRRADVLALAEGPRRDWPGPHLLHRWFEEQARRMPAAIVVESGTTLLTFRSLDRQADCYAAALRRAGAKPGGVVAVRLPRSPELVAALLGVLKAGAAYLALDEDLPLRRAEFILRDCDACAVIVRAGAHELALGRPAVEAGTEDEADLERSSPDMPPAAPAYVIYTSGSTGAPKGVAIPHGAIVNHMRWMLDRFGICAGDRILQRTPLSFDASVWEVWAPLLSGATLVLPPPDDGPFDPARLIDQIIGSRITTLQVVPSLLRPLLDQPQARSRHTLRRVFCGGEVLGAALRARFLATFRAELCNLYGPSETTIDATFHTCTKDDSNHDVPIGRPIANVVAHVLDERLEPVPCGVAGELCIGGAAVGLGYIGRDALTAERFVADPHRQGGRLFRTGDRACMGHDGTLRFLGRIDGQVKLRGNRIELGEIEAQLLRHPAVAEAAAVVQDVAGDARLVAIVRPHGEPPSTLVHDLLQWLRAHLPAYALPGTITLHASLPKTAHGKIDRVALSAMKPERASPARSHAARSATEQAVCRCFAAALAIEDVGIDDDFFHLGGHSLLVVSVRGSLAAALGIQVAVVDIFEHPTARALAAALAARTMHDATIRG